MRAALALIFAAGSGASSVRAALPADTPAAIAVSGFGALVSDYRFRGVSRSREGVAVQASVRADTRPGLYAAAWASSVRGQASADAEVDLYGGWTRTRGGWTPDVGVYGYLFPGGRGLDFYEVYGALTHDLGPASATVGVNYAPPQRGGRDNVYVYTSLSADVPRTPVTLKAGLGYEHGFAARTKFDWSLGASVRRGRFALGLSYVDTDRRTAHAGAGPVASFSVTF